MREMPCRGRSCGVGTERLAGRYCCLAAIGHLFQHAESFFVKRTKVPLIDAIGQCGQATFWSDWAALRKVRNTFVHESAWAITAASAQTAFELARQGVPEFAELQNRYCIK